MGIISNVILSSGVSIDTLALGLSKSEARLNGCIFKGILVAFIQTSFFAVGALLGDSVFFYLEQLDHWIILIVLSYFGYRTITEENSVSGKTQSETLVQFFIKSSAASLDAAAIGFSLSELLFQEPYFLIVLFITTFSFYILGYSLMYNLRKFNFKVLRWLSGLILLSLGVHIFLTHMFDHGF